jgi:hypothetical protein
VEGYRAALEHRLTKSRKFSLDFLKMMWREIGRVFLLLLLTFRQDHDAKRAAKAAALLQMDC